MRGETESSLFLHLSPPHPSGRRASGFSKDWCRCAGGTDSPMVGNQTAVVKMIVHGSLFLSVLGIVDRILLSGCLSDKIWTLLYVLVFRPYLSAAPVPDGLDDTVISQSHCHLVSASWNDIYQTCWQVWRLEHLRRKMRKWDLKMKWVFTDRQVHCCQCRLATCLLQLFWNVAHLRSLFLALFYYLCKGGYRSRPRINSIKFRCGSG